VEVMMICGVGVGVSGIVSSGLQAVLIKTKKGMSATSMGCGEIRFTGLLYPRIGLETGNQIPVSTIRLIGKSTDRCRSSTC
jgi:hypothetical protein